MVASVGVISLLKFLDLPIWHDACCAAVTQFFQKILCPIELETKSATALEVAGRLAACEGAAVRIVHVVTPPLPRPLEPVRDWETTVNDRLRQIADRYFGDRRCETLVVQGDPPAAIISAAEDFEADLIVMTTHGHTGLKRVLLGSTTERVVRESPIPVLTVHPKARNQNRNRR
jgi:nucleotide-binding universal stress UspA family protein